MPDENRNPAPLAGGDRASETVLMATSGSEDTPEKANPQQAPAKDPTAAERQRRYRNRQREADRNADRNGERGERDADRDAVTPSKGLLLPSQSGVEFELSDEGLLLIQREAYSEDAIIFVPTESLGVFVDRLTDALGYRRFP